MCLFFGPQGGADESLGLLREERGAVRAHRAPERRRAVGATPRAAVKAHVEHPAGLVCEVLPGEGARSNIPDS